MAVIPEINASTGMGNGTVGFGEIPAHDSISPGSENMGSVRKTFFPYFNRMVAFRIN